MRTREEIMTEAIRHKIVDKKTNSYYWTEDNLGAAILEVLLDIRDSLAKNENHET